MFPVFKFWVAALAASHVGLPAAGSALEAASAERSKPQANATNGLAAVAFAGAGMVGPSLRSLDGSEAVITGGAGLRLGVTDDGANIRADYAFASDRESAFYFSLGEAF
ncbi:MAG: hypothetical protein AAFZ38_00520 [Myxococcota bacterium]